MGPLTVFVFNCALIITVSGYNEKGKFPKKAESVKAKSTFNELLKALIRVDQKRIKAIEPLEALRDIHVTFGLLHRDADPSDSGNHKTVVIAFNPKRLSSEEIYVSNPSNIPTKTRNLATIEENINYLDSNDHFNYKYKQKPALRHVFRSCAKKSAKVCKKACINAAKSSCDVFVCKGKLKKRFKQDCEEFCKESFMGSD